MWPQEEIKGNIINCGPEDLEEKKGNQQKTQTVWESSFSLVRMVESDQRWMDEVQEEQLVGMDIVVS